MVNAKLFILVLPTRKKTYFIDGVQLEKVKIIKDLGVLVDRELKFSQHVGTIARRANSILGQIRRSFTFKDKLTMLKLYKTFVRSQMEHAVSLWNPWLKKDIDCLEKVQKRAVRMIQGLSGDYFNKLNQLDLTTLEDRRARGDMIQTFKIIRGIENVDYKTWFKFGSEVSTRDTRSVSEAKLSIPFARLEVRKHFFSVRMPKNWNEIPNALRESVTTDLFKISYDNYVQEAKEGPKFYVV